LASQLAVAVGTQLATASLAVLVAKVASAVEVEAVALLKEQA
jgi:hypothetical protein